MPRRPLLLILFAALAVIAGYLLLSGGEVGPHGDAAVDAGRSAGAAVQRTAIDAASPSAALLDTARVEAVASKDGARPIPEDAKWVEILVVRADTGVPVADAAVSWIDGSTYEHIDLPDQQKQWLYRDLERMANGHGWHTHSDAHGIARVAASDWTMVFGREAGLYGSLQCGRDLPPPPGGHRLELVPDLTLSVQVVDAHGAPAAGVMVAVAQYGADDKFLRYWQWGALACTDASGMARAVHLQDWRSELLAATPVAHWRVRPYLPGCRDAGVEFEPKSPPADPVVLRLPPCGSITAQVELRGQAIGGGKGRGGVTLWDVGDRDQEWWTEVEADGSAHFAHVPIGRDYIANANLDSTQLQRQFAGPRAEAECISVRFALDEDQVVIIGRARDAAGELVGKAALTVQCMADDFYGGGTMHTDAQGRFQKFCLGATKTTVKAHRLIVDWNREHEVPLRAVLGERELLPGVQDLGDVVLTPGPLLVAGRLWCGEQPYTRPAQLVIEHFDAKADPPDWLQLDGLMMQQDKDGSFAVRGDVPTGRLRLALPAYDHLPIAPIEFTAGTTDLAVQVQEGAGLTVTLLLPEDMPWGATLVLVPETGTAVAKTEGPYSHDALLAEASPIDAVRQQAQWRALPPGSYRLEYRLFAAEQPLISIDHVAVPPPAAGDPRLRDIDLRDKIEVLTLRLCDRSGAPLPQGANGIAMPLAQRLQPPKAFDVEGIGARLAFPPGAVDLLLAVRGFRPQELRGLRGEVRVMLEPWPQLQLQFVDLPPLPDACHLLVELQPPVAESLQYQSQWSTGSQDDYLQPPIEAQTVVDGRASMLAGDGPQRLRLRLVHREEDRADRGAVVLRDVTPQQCVAGPVPVQVHVPVESLQRAIERMQLQAK